MILAGNSASVTSNSNLSTLRNAGDLALRQPSLQGGGAALQQLPKVVM